MNQNQLDRELLEAARKGEVQTAGTLLDSEANIHYQNQEYFGTTPLHIASANNKLDVVKLLLARKADPNMPDKFGSSALHRASFNGHQSVVEFLLNSNANITLQDNDGDTPLHDASYNGNAAVVEVLLARNADTSIKNKNGQTARDRAVAGDEPAVVKLLDDFQKKQATFMPSPVSPLKYSASTSSPSAIKTSSTISTATTATTTTTTTTTTISAANGNATEEALRKEMEKLRLQHQEELEKLKLSQEMEKLRRQHQEELAKLKQSPQSQAMPSNSTHTGKAVEEWSVEDVQAWVSSLVPALAKYSQLFIENGVDGESFLAFDKGDLTALGINAAHATMIIQKLKSRTQVVASPPALPQEKLYPELDMDDHDDEVDLSKLVIDKNKKLGTGNFGEVYLGTIGERRVAVKVLIGGDKKELEKEISTWEKLSKHENVAQLFGVIEKDGSNCIIMKYYPGGTLKEELDKTRKRMLAMRKVKTLSILLGIANGLKHLHASNIVHRDLAARNILFENSARDLAVITDFGLSREVGQLGKEYYMARDGPLPLAWMPPETLRHRKSTVKSDVWSFGVVVWEVITQGLTPLSNLDMVQIIELAFTGELRPTLLKSLNNVEDGDPELVKVVEMCLVDDPALRPFERNRHTLTASHGVLNSIQFNSCWK